MPTPSEGRESGELAALLEVCDRLGRARVLVVGDAMLDRFVRGSVKRVSPEAPIPILSIEGELSMPGGAGNVVRNLAALGVGTAFAGAVGDDPAGEQLAALLAQKAVLGTGLAVEPGRRTPVKTRYVAGGQQLLRTDFETVAPLAKATEDALAAAVGQWLKAVDVVLVSDYAKGAVTPALLAALMAAARAAGRPVVVDPKGADFARYAGAAVITPNRGELSAAAGRALATEDDYEEAARVLMAAHGFGAVCLTRSEEGVSLYGAGSDPVHVRAGAREVFDVSGAGDTVAAVLAAGLAVGATLPLCAELANTAAGIVVGKVGTAVVHPDELRRAVLRLGGEDATRKILPRERLLETVALWRGRGLRVGFTNGCFDLLHPGHAAMLAGARQECDRLVVGLNTDASVRRLKGPSRPIQDQASRAHMLASLGCVDAVVLFDEDTPLELIRAVAPDMLAKGGDYTLDTVVGADLVMAAGGRVVLVPLEQGRSTTDIIRRIRKEDGASPEQPSGRGDSVSDGL
ncbi:MAG: D-glycero-beta-D-manno-heptose-7-phosphate kinase [Solidesulfovibrio sp.]|uniref:D-glycero-beta-D-manno-heptose-7-phosphate kinase n=1 Tax=Solidesulfovibrio sp. TaxID=2910990 RepID=UPI003158D924